MDLQAIIDNMAAMSCIVSVEKLDNGRRGKIRIVAGNKAYVDSIENPAPGVMMLSNKFVPNMEYTNYLTRDLNFEEYCYRSAVEKKNLHSYAHPDRMDVWFDMSFIPMQYEEGNLCYCIYMMNISNEPSSLMASSISGDIAANVLETCIKLRGAEDFIAALKDVIKDIRDMCDAEHCCILQVDEYARKCKVLCEAFSKDTKLLPMENYVDDAFYDIAESWEGTIAGSSCLIAKNKQDMEIVKERNPVWYESISAAGGKTIVLFPLKSNNQLMGYIWAINFDSKNAVRIKDTLEITTFILGSELGNYYLLDRLKTLSSKDMLTGVMNRNEMNNLVQEMSEEIEEDVKTVGVIFTDLNGLKVVNDIEGHIAGDVLLKNASKALRKVFDEKYIFRAGGDEFVVIKKGVTEDEINEKIEDIRKACCHYKDLSISMGGCVVDDSRNVRTALRIADENMYADKEKYYKEHPDKKYEAMMSRRI